MRRRAYLTTLLGGASISVAGCLSSDGDGETADDGGTDSDGTTADAVDPEIVSLSLPNPNAVSTDDEYGDAGEEYFIEIQNTGDPGPIEYTLVWLEDQTQDPNGPNSVPVVSHERFFDAGERREVSVRETRPDGYDAFGFRLRAGEVTAEVANSGGEGRVEVLLLEGNEIVESKKLLLEADARGSVSFDTGHHLDWENLDFEVQAV